MRRQFKQELLVTTWKNNKPTKTKEKKVMEKESQIVLNNGWSMFYKKHRPPDMKIKELAIETGIHPYTLSRWDKGIGSPNFRLFFFFLEYVADKDNKPIEEVFSELYHFVNEYGTEFKR